MMTTTTEYHYLTFEEPVAAEDVPTTTIQRQNYPTAELRAPPPLEDLLVLENFMLLSLFVHSKPPPRISLA